MGVIRKAEIKDVSRIAEILVFTKRVNYRRIFRDDGVSFGEIQVLPLAMELLSEPWLLGSIWVYDDGIVKGMMNVRDGEIKELYVDDFFQGAGIGGELLDYAVSKLNARYLWVLEKNERAVAFYMKHGFERTPERKIACGTNEFEIKLLNS